MNSKSLDDKLINSSFINAGNNKSSYGLVIQDGTKTKALSSTSKKNNLFHLTAIGTIMTMTLTPCSNSNLSLDIIETMNSRKMDQLISQDKIYTDEGGFTLVMEDKLNKDTFTQFEKRIEEKIDYVSSNVDEIKAKQNRYITSEQLESTKNELIQAINSSKSGVTMWVMGGVITVLLAIFGYMFLNPDKAINIFSAINGG